MRVGKLPLIPYFRPGDKALANEIAKHADKHAAVLLANHGPVVSGNDLDSAAYAMEELEETSKLMLLLHGQKIRTLDRIANTRTMRNPGRNLGVLTEG